MAGEEDKADVFAIPDFWQTSKWLEGLGQETSSPFFIDDLKGHLSNSLVQIASAAPDRDGFFKLSSIEPAKDEDSETNEASDDNRTTAESTAGTELTNDVWMELGKAPDKVPLHKTWDAFLSGSTASSQPPLMTEAGPAVYDALLCWSIDPLELKNVDVPMVQARPYFASLLALAVAHESVFFFRKDKGRSFVPALPKMRISGYSRDILQGLEKQCLSCGTMLLELRSFVQRTYLKKPTRCQVALASAIEQVLKVVQQHVTVYGRNPRSLLEVQSTTKGLLAILEPFQRLTSKLRRGCSDEDVLTTVFHEAYSVDYGEEQLREIMREVLRRVSRPWVEFLEEWIGTRREDGVPFTKSSIGESKGFVKVENETYMDDFGQDVDDIDFRLNEDKMPDFMPHDIAQSIFETGKNLRFIRTCHPEHPLAKINTISSAQPPKAEWLYDWDAILDLEERVNDYRNNLLDAIEKSHSDSGDGTRDINSFHLQQSNELQFFGVEKHQVEQQILASIDHFNQPLSDAVAEDSLGRAVRQRLSASSRLCSGNIDFAPHWSLLPVLSFGSIASAQSQVVSRESLKLLFSSHDLRSHLKMHRDFHLFGDGMFCSRLSHALFDPDLETAERKAGVARQGGVMGLRLGGRDNWPPASSELQLALMGVLSESFKSKNTFTGRSLESFSRDSSELPGDLSFAVRDLSPEEINECMNPDSLEALDFLRLAYKAPDALSSIITPAILMQYDRIFKLLLRLLRMVYVVNQLSRDVNARTTRWEDPTNSSYRFAREAHHFVSGIASYFLDSGIALPWQAFEGKLDKIQADLGNPTSRSQPEKAESPDRLREFHSQVLDRIMLALFLKKRQLPVLKLLEEIFNAVLHYAKYSRNQALGRDQEDEGLHNPEDLYRKFKKKVQIFITVCRGMTEKARLGVNKADDDLGLRRDGIGEEHMVAQLLMKLDMNDYYSKH
ncbi:Fc.00g088960.m01.CDS01 [Cosmosporella sp. VM-42]